MAHFSPIFPLKKKIDPIKHFFLNCKSAHFVVFGGGV